MLVISRFLSAVGISKEKKLQIEGMFKNRDIEGFLALYKDTIVVHGASGCWLWTGQVEKPRRMGDQAYGKISIGGRKGRVHKIAYEIANGPVVQEENIEVNSPQYKEVDHTCRFPLCCNPAHMQVVTKSVNSELIKKRMVRDQNDPAEYATWVANQNDKIRTIFEGWKQRNYRPDFWEYLLQFKTFFQQWQEEITLSKDEHMMESIATSYINKHPELIGTSLEEEEDLTPELAHVSSSSSEIIRKLINDGWVPERQSGSHITFDKLPHPHIITVPHPKKDMGKGLERKIDKEMVCSDLDPKVP